MASDKQKKSKDPPNLPAPVLPAALAVLLATETGRKFGAKGTRRPPAWPLGWFPGPPPERFCCHPATAQGNCVDFRQAEFKVIVT